MTKIFESFVNLLLADRERGRDICPPPFEIKIVYSNQKYSYDQNVFKNLIKIFAPPPFPKVALQPPLTPFPKIILSPLWINNLSQIEVEIKYLISIYSPDFSKEQNVRV